jgi:hypothetical protein
MVKYRIVEIASRFSASRWAIQKRVLFWWAYAEWDVSFEGAEHLRTYDSLETAKEALYRGYLDDEKVHVVWGGG